MKAFTSLYKIVGRFTDLFNTFRVGERSAALAYYALFAFSPLIILVLSIANLLSFGGVIESGVENFLVQHFGSESGQFFLNNLENVQTSSVDIIATIIGLLLVLYGATNFFRAIQTSLFDIFSVTPKNLGVIQKYVFVYLYALMYLAFFLFFLAFLFLAQVFLSAGIGVIEDIFSYDMSLFSVRFITQFVIFSILSLFFALTYKIFSQGKITLLQSFFGGAFAGIGVLILNRFLGIYLGMSSSFALYGAAGFLVAMLFWVYLFGFILFLGALLTRYISKIPHGKTN